MAEVWYQSRYGNRINLVKPTVGEVCFPEICHTLAHINRYCGAARPDVSVALHSLIVDDIVAAMFPAARPWGILHDFHEARLTDITTPVKDAMSEIEFELNGANGVVEGAIHMLKWRHDLVIWAAAGLDRPCAEIAKQIKIADRIALKVERKYHLPHPPEPWATDLDGTPDFDGYHLETYPESPRALGVLLLRRVRTASRLGGLALAA